MKLNGLVCGCSSHLLKSVDLGVIRLSLSEPPFGVPLICILAPFCFWPFAGISVVIALQHVLPERLLLCLRYARADLATLHVENTAAW